MSDRGTLSNEFPGWYVQFQTDILLQLPCPGEISKDVALSWHDNRGAMKRALHGALVPQTPETAKPAPQPLLIPVGTVVVAATTTPFVVRDRFVQNMKLDAPLKISYLGGNFKEWFLGKTEKPFAGSTLRYAKLSRNSTDASIIAALGGEEKAETTLSEFFSLLEKQPDGKSGPLLTNNSWVNILYIKDVNDVLRAVFADWNGDGWFVGADAVTGPYPWDDERQIFSRDSR